MARQWWLPRRKGGSAPKGFVPIQLYQDHAQHDYQAKWTWPYPSAPAHEQRSALVNAWSGNQLPGPTNFIPGVAKSYMTWNIPTSYANTLKNQQYNAGYNIGGQSAYTSSALMLAVQQAWQNRAG